MDLDRQALASESEYVPTPEELTIGNRLKKDAYADNGDLLLKAGEPIETEAQLTRLLHSDVYFGDKRPEQAAGDSANGSSGFQPPSNMTVLEKLNADVRRALESKSSAVSGLKSIFASVEEDGVVDMELVHKTAAGLLDNVVHDAGALLSLVQLKNADEYTFTHSVNVGIIAVHLAHSLGETEHIQELGVGALLHDVGKAKTPASILNKPGPLDAFQKKAMDMHPTLGVNLLRQSGYTDDIALACVKDHHENMIGTGYPSGKQGRELSKFAKITAIADVYDALTTDRPYRKAMNPRQAMLLMTQQMAPQFDPALLRAFTTAIGYFPVGSTVELSSGRMAVVVEHNPEDPLRPVVEQLSSLGALRSMRIDLKAQDELFVRKFVEPVSCR